MKDKVEVGDLVKYHNNKKGIVKAVKAWYLPKGLVDINNHILPITDVIIIKKQVVQKQYQKYL
jgi:hypothetical protein